LREKILITGPGGRVGPRIIPLLRREFALRLFDTKPFPAEGDDEFVPGDIRDFETLKRACEGCHAMIHLAAISDEADFHSQLLPVNLAGVYNAFEAARQAGLRKVVFASTGQVILNYTRSAHVTTDMPPRPSTVYACTKLFGEALARHYAENCGLPVICIRLCYFRAYDDPLLRIPDHGVQYDWCSPRDLAQLLTKALQSERSFGIYFGISNNSKGRWDLGNAQRDLGYQPEDRAEDYLPGGRHGLPLR
jgi:uronate dehydrogenase